MVILMLYSHLGKSLLLSKQLSLFSLSPDGVFVGVLLKIGYC
jgi:hypothetical protein